MVSRHVDAAMVAHPAGASSPGPAPGCLMVAKPESKPESRPVARP